MTSEEDVSARIDRLPFSRWHVRMMAIAGLAHFSDAFDSLAIAFVLPVLAELWRLSHSEIGYLISAGYIGQMLGAVLFGWLAEKIGRRGVLQITVAIIGGLSLACGLAWSYSAFIVFRSLQGLGLGGEVPVAATYMNEISAARFRGRLVLLLMSVFAFGIVFMALASSWLIPNLGWRSLLFIGAVPSLLAIWLRRLMPESPRWLASRGRLAEADAIVTAIDAEIGTSGRAVNPVDIVGAASVSRPAAALSDLFGRPYAARTVLAWALMLSAAIVGYSLLTWLPTIYRTVLKVSVAQALLFGLYGSIGSLLGVLSAAFLVDGIGRRSTLFLGYGGSAAILLLLWKAAAYLAPGTIALLAASGLYFITIPMTGLYLYVGELYPTRLRALGVGAASAWLRIGSIVGPTVVGWSLFASDLSVVFLTFAAIAMLGACLILLFAGETMMPVEANGPPLRNGLRRGALGDTEEPPRRRQVS